MPPNSAELRSGDVEESNALGKLIATCDSRMIVEVIGICRVVMLLNESRETHARAGGRPCGPVRISAGPWIPREIDQQQTTIIGVFKRISSILASSGNSNL